MTLFVLLMLAAGDSPEASTRALSEDELSGWPAAELRLVRNEIFARRGHVFSSEDLKTHFAATDWYKPDKPVSDAELSQLERDNIALLKRLEATKPTEPSLFPAGVKGKMGFIDATGKLKLSAVYEDAGDFSEDLAAVRLDGKWGYIDAKGTLVIPATLEGRPREFRLGLAPMQKDGKWGFIDTRGEVRVTPAWADVRGYAQGLSVVLRDRKYGLIDRRGTVVVEPTYDRIDAPGEGLWVVTASSGRGAVNRRGELVVPPTFLELGAFSEGLAAAKTKEGWGFIDRRGNWVIKPRFVHAAGFVDGLAAVNDGGRRGFINRSGELKLTDSAWTSVQSFSQGLAPVATWPKDEEDPFGAGPSDVLAWHYIDKQGREVISQLPCVYSEKTTTITGPVGPGPGTYTEKQARACDFAAPFDGPWARVRSARNKIYYLNTGGSRVLSGDDEVRGFRGALTLVVGTTAKGGDSYRYVNRTGKVVFKWEKAPE